MLRCGAARPPGRTPVRSFIFGDVRHATGGDIARAAGRGGCEAYESLRASASMRAGQP